MSSSEAIMWAVEKDPALRSDFCNLTLLDVRPSDERLLASLRRALAAIPRLRQRVVTPPLRIATPEFADDPTLDLDAHIRVVAVPAPNDERALLDLCGQLAQQPLDRARPLWEFTLIDGLAGGQAALLQKIHHTITDGVGGLKLSLALVDFERDPEGLDDPGGLDPVDCRTGPLGVTRDAMFDAAHRGIRGVKKTVGAAGSVVIHPLQVPAMTADAARLVGSMQRQVLVRGNARSDVIENRSLRRHFATQRIALTPMRIAANRLGGSVNDAFVTGICAALGRYHERLGSEVEELRLAMPVSTRARGDEATNRFAPARVVVPIQPAYDIPDLFAEVHGRLSTIKNESALAAADGLAGLVSGLPTSMLVALTRSQARTIDFVASNLRGSPVPLYLAGTRILASYPFGPRTASALNVTMLSYCDEVHMGINIDPEAIVDPGEFMRDLGEAFAEYDTFG